jgi:hypothetical protein
MASSLTTPPSLIGYGMALTQRQQHLIDASAEIMGESEPQDLRFLHTILAQCSLPYREPPDQARDYIRENGKASLIISAGYLMDQVTRKPVLQGIPYGSKPRLLMIHLCTEAVRNQTTVIPIAESMSAFMRDLGLAVSGGKKGSIGLFKDQLNRLAASRIQMIFNQDELSTLINPAPMIHRFDVWFPGDPRQKVLWPSEVVLSEEFFNSLKGHALPLDPRALRTLQRSARAIDCYTWLSHRLPRVSKNVGDFISWKALMQQFGGEITDDRDFRRRMLGVMKDVLAVYPKGRVIQEDGGMRLYNSPPPISRK